MNFTTALAHAERRNDSMLCVGLDPEPAKFPGAWKGDASRIFDFCAAIVDATKDLVIAFKPQIAYFAAHRAEDQLERLMAHIRAVAPDVPVILDAKRGDIGATAEQYAREGAAPTTTAILGGHVDFTITSVFPKAQIESGKVRAVAVTGAKRWFLLPDTPTVAEQGYPKYEASTWQGLSVPKGTPRNVIEVVNREVVKVLRAPDVVSRINAQGFEVIGDTPEQAAQFLAAEIAKWGEAVKFSGAQPE